MPVSANTTNGSSATPKKGDEKAMKVWQSLVNSKTISEDQVKDFYANWAKTYDEDLVSIRAQYQRRAAEQLAALVPQDARPTFEILDVACGTGLVGAHLTDLGFRTLDGADMSREMLDKLDERGLYRNTFCTLVGDGNKIEAAADESYDAAIVCGGFAQSHMPVDSLREIARVIKPGGYFVNGMTEYYLQTVKSLHALEPLMAAMEAEGVWEQVSRDSIPNMIADKNACIHIFRKK